MLWQGIILSAIELLTIVLFREHPVDPPSAVGKMKEENKED